MKGTIKIKEIVLVDAPIKICDTCKKQSGSLRKGAITPMDWFRAEKLYLLHRTIPDTENNGDILEKNIFKAEDGTLDFCSEKCIKEFLLDKVKQIKKGKKQN